MTFTARNENSLQPQPEQRGQSQSQSRPQPEPLPVKELAAALGVSVRFIYHMRSCGFRMRGHTRNQQMATLAEARAWIKTNDFRLIHGVAVIGANKVKEIPAGGMI